MIGSKPQPFTIVQEDLGTSIAYALWDKVRKCINYIDASRPVGSIMFFYATQQSTLTNPAGQNVDLPDTNVWQFCDGSVVSNINSPLNGITLPDCRGRFYTQADGSTGIVAGQDSVDLTHNHTGNTGVLNDQAGRNADTFGSVYIPQPHVHPISNDLGVLSLLPIYREAQLFIRIV